MAQDSFLALHIGGPLHCERRLYDGTPGRPIAAIVRGEPIVGLFPAMLHQHVNYENRALYFTGTEYLLIYVATGADLEAHADELRRLFGRMWREHLCR